MAPLSRVETSSMMNQRTILKGEKNEKALMVIFALMAVPLFFATAYGEGNAEKGKALFNDPQLGGGDYTPRIIPLQEEAAVPIEEHHILWYR